MDFSSKKIGLLRCESYTRDEVKNHLDSICNALDFSVTPGSKILLKPNLVTAKGHNGLACTNPEFIAAVAEWLIDHGEIVSIGDSPALGNATRIMDICGITKALKGLPVKLLDFSETRTIRLANGFNVKLATAALDCDVLINLPKVKAHTQMLVSLGVKNYFGTMVGWHKFKSHMLYGDKENRFVKLLVDLLDVLPSGLTIIDGITAMHQAGPVAGSPLSLSIIGASSNPVALDTALLSLLNINHHDSPLWAECNKRKIPGSKMDQLEFSLATPFELRTKKFIPPTTLQPIRFLPGRALFSSIKRIFSSLPTSSK